MERNPKKTPKPPLRGAGKDPAQIPEKFPSTRLSVLQAAAHGDWNRFYDEYLVACAREAAIACRTRGLPFDDVDDLIQTLVVRLQQEGGFAKQWREKLRALEADGNFRGNIPAKFLHAREHLLGTAKFRTYLKAVIKRLVLEALQKRRSTPRELGDFEAAIDGLLEESIASSIDHNLVVACLERAARTLADESGASSTKGEQRLFAALYYTTVERLSQDALAARFRVHRTTATGLVKASRQRFVRLLEAATGIDDRDYLRRTIAKDPEALVQALSSAMTNSKQ